MSGQANLQRGLNRFGKKKRIDGAAKTQYPYKRYSCAKVQLREGSLTGKCGYRKSVFFYKKGLIADLRDADPVMLYILQDFSQWSSYGLHIIVFCAGLLDSGRFALNIVVF